MEGCFYEQEYHKAEAEIIFCVSDHPHSFSIYCVCICQRSRYQDRKRRKCLLCDCKEEDADGGEQISKVKWTDYLAGILAREIPEDYEREALKAQTVLIRTALYRELENSEDKVLSEDYMSTAEMEARWSKEEFEEYYRTYTEVVKATE